MRNALLTFFSFLLLGSAASAQKTVTGKVVDNNGLPLSGVSVRIKGTNKGTETGADGSFKLQADASVSLEFTMVGYTAQTATASDNMKITMSPVVGELGQLVLVGTRRSGRVKVETPVPVDVINVGTATMPTARMDLTSVLNYAAPSFNYNKQSGSDGADHIDLATLRGLGPDQTLVLINGKRRHQTAFIAVFGTRGRGNSGTDLNAFPASAIDRVEILRDGASAQYGSDAIAGVINLVLKKNINKVTGSIGFSGYNDPKFNTAYASDLYKDYEHGKNFDGQAFNANLNFGVAVGKKGGFFNMTLEGMTTGKTYRQALKTADYYNDPDAMYLNIYRRGHGEASLDLAGSFYNMEVPVNEKMSFYSFGGYNFKSSDAFAFTRNFSAKPERFPTDNNGNLVFVPSIMKVASDGDTYYSPHIQTKIRDFATTGGVKGRSSAGWDWDFSNTTGSNNFHFYGDKTFNASRGSAQTHFDDGGFSFTQNTTNLNFSKELDTKVNLGVGAEFRYENYKIFSGEEASYKNYDPNGVKASGAQGFPGYQPNDEVNAHRSVLGAYADLEFDVDPKVLLDFAARLENYSDFGFTHNYKFATRYKASPKVNLRGSFSTGFRAPSLQQINFSSTFTTVQAGNIAEVKIAPNYSPITKAAGIPELKQEKSYNASLGMTWAAAKGLNITADGYWVNVVDRVVLSGQFDGSDANLDASLRSQMAALHVSLAQFFANAVNTTNMGIDVVVDYTKKVRDNKLKLLLTGNYQHMTINKINVPAKLSGSNFLRQTFLSDREQKFILASAPKAKATLNVEYEIKKTTFGARVTYFGKVVILGYGQDGLGINPMVPLDNGGGLVPDQYNYTGKVVPDIYFSHPLGKRLTLYLGIDNLLNAHPDFGVAKGAKDWAYNNETGGPWDAVQMGTNGRRLFGRIAFSF